MNNNNYLENLLIQKDHILYNNRDDENFEFQLEDINNKINKEKERLYVYNKNNSDYTGNIKFSYEGPIYKFDTYIENSKLLYTIAKTKTKAKSNFIYQIKKYLNLEPYTKITIDDSKIIEVSRV